MTLKLDLQYSKTKSYAKVQLNMSKHVREKLRKLCIFSILSSKRGIIPTKIDANWRHWNLICSTELDMCLWNTDAPGGNKVTKSYIHFDLPHPQGHVMSVRCE